MPCLCPTHPAVARGEQQQHSPGGRTAPLGSGTKGELRRVTLEERGLLKETFHVRSGIPAPAEPTAVPHHCTLLQLLTSDPACSSRYNTRHLILEAAGGCEKLSLQSEIVLSYWKISFSSKLCMFAAVLCSLPGFLFFTSTTPAFSSAWPASLLPYLLLALMNLAIIL